MSHQILLNEVAPRPHNSGHHTIESCYTSQYEQHLRAVIGLPLGDPSMKAPAAIMYNILGEDEVIIFFPTYVSHCFRKQMTSLRLQDVIYVPRVLKFSDKGKLTCFCFF